MSKENEQTAGNEADNELSALLDSALDDFGSIRNTDDEIDLMMASYDEAAAEKAAKNFDSIIKDINERITHEQVAFISQPNLAIIGINRLVSVVFSFNFFRIDIFRFIILQRYYIIWHLWHNMTENNKSICC